MSSMHRAATFLLLLFLAVTSVPARCQEGGEWDQARMQLISSQRGNMGQAIERWRQLSSNDGYAFNYLYRSRNTFIIYTLMSH